MAFFKKPNFVGGTLRIVIALVLAAQWISSVIVLGLTAYLIHQFGRTGHETYDVIVASVNVWGYGWGMFLPLVKSYKGYLLVVHLVFSYLWLTTFIFAAQDYSTGECGEACSKKRTIEAFTWLAFFFTFAAIPIEAMLVVRTHRSNPASVTDGTSAKKEVDGVPVAESSTTSTV